jgi:hypothetical protein
MQVASYSGIYQATPTSIGRPRRTSDFGQPHFGMAQAVSYTSAPDSAEATTAIKNVLKAYFPLTQKAHQEGISGVLSGKISVVNADHSGSFPATHYPDHIRPLPPEQARKIIRAGRKTSLNGAIESLEKGLRKEFKRPIILFDLSKEAPAFSANTGAPTKNSDFKFLKFNPDGGFELIFGPDPEQANQANQANRGITKDDLPKELAEIWNNDTYRSSSNTYGYGWSTLRYIPSKGVFLKPLASATEQNPECFQTTDPGLVELAHQLYVDFRRLAFRLVNS